MNISSAEKQQFQELNLHIGGFSHLMDKNFDFKKEIKQTFPIPNEENDFFLLENILSPRECENLIQESRKQGFFQLDDFDEGKRNNQRRRTFDPVMSQIMFERISPFIPMKTLLIDECRWDFHHFLDFWRYLRYQDQETFKTHYDGSKKILDKQNDIYEMSIFTLNIYLNEGFKGGNTRFYLKCKENARIYNEEEAGPVTHIIPSKTGQGLIFNHCTKGYLHDGEPIYVCDTEVKEKFLLRADLIYRLNSQDVTILKKKIEEGTCRFFNQKVAEEHLVEDFVGNIWKCACNPNNLK